MAGRRITLARGARAQGRDDAILRARHGHLSVNGDMGSNPLFRWFALFGDRMTGPDFEAGLANLKALAEKP